MGWRGNGDGEAEREKYPFGEDKCVRHQQDKAFFESFLAFCKRGFGGVVEQVCGANVIVLLIPDHT